MISLRERLPMDPTLLLLGLALMAVGLVAISSASVEYGTFHHDNGWYHTQRHLFYLVVSLAVATGAYFVPAQFWLATGWFWLLGGVALLVLVLLPGVGKDVNGSQRWLPLGPFTLQASEFAKFTVLIYLAGYLVRHGDELRSRWQGFAKPMAVLLLVSVLLMAEPDFGATVILVVTAFGMLFLAGVKLTSFLGVMSLSVAGLVALVFAAPYRVARLTAYTDPWADPYGSGFQLIQSLIAFGRGEWVGVGLGNSIQKLFYLPEAHTDFVFSIWAEETGFLGAMLVIGLFVALIGRILWVARQAQIVGDEFGANLCFGVALVFSGQAFVNIGVSSGLLPTKGLTLPFVSYGGSSLIVCCTMLALVLRIERDLCVAPSRKAAAPANKKRARA
ncbi:putative lipid II flippase FtsW [Kineobactrum sediminis]|uniref:Probable peptidoglycan glycosyltransferase FtsW n=1 Tax=Kineobactrum sediminis TaxID=1905677 RepID=A0A2N5Y3I3_9GAMM|nr:putative lipid II flippase FtsW [Kineobactrum sediminis]PLW82937.1 putative lipid II flippase FtsW [Kineobactrum sediminis]